MSLLPSRLTLKPGSTYSPPIVIPRFGRWLVVAALVVSMGSPWSWLQACAWAGMVVQYSQSDSILTAFQKTLDGRHPCKLCRSIANAKSTEKGKTQGSKTKLKTELFLSSKPFEPCPHKRDVCFQEVPPLIPQVESPPMLRPPIQS